LDAIAVRLANAADLIVAASVPAIYRHYFGARRRWTSQAEAESASYRRAGGKVGRNVLRIGDAPLMKALDRRG
jgi:hypothetical protein